MGINTRTLIAKENFKKIDYFDFVGIYECLGFGRWHNFREKFELSNDVWLISIRDLVAHLASVSGVKQEDRENVVRYINYDIIFVADSFEYDEDKYINARSFFYNAIEQALMQAKKGVFPNDR